MGYQADKAVLDAAGVDLDVLDSGHYDVSMACGERVLLPRPAASTTDLHNCVSHPG